jgi:topoisomerase-4 subunit A
MKLKENDELVSVSYTSDETIIVTKNGYYLRYNTNEIPVIGVKASGVKGINLANDEVIYGGQLNNSYEYLNIFTNNNTSKRIKLDELKSLTRAKKGNMLIKKNKTVVYYLVNAYLTSSKDIIIIKSDSELKELKNSDIPIMDLTSNGSSITKNYVDKYDLKYNIVKIINDIQNNDEAKEEKIEKQVSFEDFTKDFKI